MFDKLVCLYDLDDQCMMKLNPEAKIAWVANFVLTLFFRKNQAGFDYYYNKLIRSPQLQTTNPFYLMKNLALLNSLRAQWFIETQRQGLIKRFFGKTPECMKSIPDETCGWREEELDTP